MKNYFRILLLIMGLVFSTTSHAQSDPQHNTSVTAGGITDLTLFPNPVSTGKIYITTKQNLTKNVEIYDVLGKKIISATLFGKELNISKLTAGIYILKIREGNNSATRKLVVK